MALHEDKRCPRCKQKFVCKPATITQCHCAKTDLPRETLEALRLRYKGCLCAACLLGIHESKITSIP